MILFVADQVPKGKSNSFSCLGNSHIHFRVTAAPSLRIPRGPGHAPATQAPVSYYSTFSASDYLTNNPIWGPTRVSLAASPGPWLSQPCLHLRRDSIRREMEKCHY